MNNREDLVLDHGMLSVKNLLATIESTVES
jgi:hypothetical protein